MAIEGQVLIGLFHVIEIDSPVLTSSPAIAAYVIEMRRDFGIVIEVKMCIVGRELKPS